MYNYAGFFIPNDHAAIVTKVLGAYVGSLLMKGCERDE